MERHAEEADVPLDPASFDSRELATLVTAYNVQSAQRRDIADRLNTLNETLESRILERTRELEQAVHRADSANQAKRDFLGNMSHELRTPLNGILGLCFLALHAKPEPGPALKGYLRKINQSGDHLLAIISNILDFSKIEAGRVELEEIDFDPADIVRGAIDKMAGAAEVKGLALTSEVDHRIDRMLRGDSTRISQVLLNYLDNAIKFTARGKIVVRAIRLPGEDDACNIRFEVSDTGVGLTEEQQGRLFQVFQQGDNSTTREYGGTGLGLAISKQLVGLMGGKVGVDSVPGRGSTFWFTASLAPAQVPGATQTRTQAARERDADTRELYGSRILLAEDNPINQEVVVALLELVGAVVTVAGNGREALDALQHDTFDCVLMDMQMPVMGGVEAARSIRSDPATAAIPVIALTANAGDGDERMCMEAGMDDVVVKPIDPVRLHAVVARHLARSRQEMHSTA